MCMLSACGIFSPLKKEVLQHRGVLGSTKAPSVDYGGDNLFCLEGGWLSGDRSL